MLLLARHRLFALLAALLALAASSPARGPSAPEAANLGLVASSLGRHGPVLALVASERSNGQDFDSNGSLSGQVLHLYNLQARKARNLGFQSARIVQGTPGDLVPFEVIEAEIGRDCNGDGDLQDWVLHSYSIADDAVSTQCIVVHQPRVGGDLVVYTRLFRDETRVHRLSTGSDVAVGRGHRWAFFARKWAFLLSVEYPIDENGDGDMNDTVLRAIHPQTLAEIPLGAASRSGEYQVSENAAAIVVEEDGVDLNDDGDGFDDVVHLIDIPRRRDSSSHPSLVNTRLAVSSPFSERSFALSNQWLAIAVDEANQRLDLNNDSDLDDRVLATVSVRNGVQHNTGHSVFDDNAGGRLDVSGGLVGFAAGPDTTPLGIELMFWDAKRRRLTRSETFLGSGGFALGQDSAIFSRAESRWGDLNGDGDAFDRVATIFDLRRDAVRNLGIAIQSGRYAAKRWAAMEVSEHAQGQDFNGDGDLTGSVCVLYDFQSQRLLPVPAEASCTYLSGQQLLLSVREQFTPNDGSDLNGDGDTTDSVLHVVSLRGSRSRRK